MGRTLELASGLARQTAHRLLRQQHCQSPMQKWLMRVRQPPQLVHPLEHLVHPLEQKDQPLLPAKVQEWMQALHRLVQRRRDRRHQVPALALPPYRLYRPPKLQTEGRPLEQELPQPLRSQTNRREQKLEQAQQQQVHHPRLQLLGRRLVLRPNLRICQPLAPLVWLHLWMASQRAPQKARAWPQERLLE